MNNRSGPYPHVNIDAAGSGVVSQAGAVVLLETARVPGLDRELSTAMDPWRRRGARHDPGEVVLDLAVALAVGVVTACLTSRCCGASRGWGYPRPPEAGGVGLVASDPTVSRAITALAADAATSLAAIRAARAVARGRAVGVGRAARPRP